MKSKQSGKLLQAQVNSSVGYRVLNALCFMVIACVFVIAICFVPLQGVQWYWLTLCSVAGVAVIYVLGRLFGKIRFADNTIEGAVVAIAMVVYIALQVFVSANLFVGSNGQGGLATIFTHAQNYVLQGETPGNYFVQNPQHIGQYAFWAGFMRVLKQTGVRSFAFPAFVFNLVCMDVAVFLLYRGARKLFGQGKGLYMLLLAFVTLPFMLFLALCYVNMLPLLLVVLCLRIWLRVRKLWMQRETGRAIQWFCGLSLLAGFGALLSEVLLLLWLACALDCALLLLGAGRWYMLLAGLPVVAAAYLGAVWLLRGSALLPAGSYGYWLPFANVQEGMWRYITTRTGAIFGDATYTATGQMVYSGSLQGLREFVSGQGRFVPGTLYVCFGVQAALLVGACASAVNAVIAQNNCLSFARVAFVLYITFVLVFTVNNETMLFMLPLLLFCCVEGSMPGTREEPMQKKAEKTTSRKAHESRKDASVAAAKAGKKKAVSKAVAKKQILKQEAVVQHTPEDRILEDIHLEEEQAAVKEDLFSLDTLDNPVEIFDVPQGDPFFEIARTSQWSLDDLYQAQERKEQQEASHEEE